MGAPSRELWGMLIICVPLMIWQFLTFYQADWMPGYFEVVFEIVFVACMSYLIWRYGGVPEAVTKVLEFTRVWDRAGSEAAKQGDGTSTSHLIRSEVEISTDTFCRGCGFRMTSSARFCRRCGREQ